MIEQATSVGLSVGFLVGRHQIFYHRSAGNPVGVAREIGSIALGDEFDQTVINHDLTQSRTHLHQEHHSGERVSFSENSSQWHRIDLFEHILAIRHLNQLLTDNPTKQ